MYQGIATKVLTGEVRISYEHLTAPYQSPQGGEPKYSVTLLIPKTDTATKADIDASIRAAYEDGVANKWKGLRPQLRNPLIYDGDGVRQSGQAFGPECKGHWVITASSKQAPGVVGIDNINVQLSPADIYSGMYARATINFFAFDSHGSKGIGAGLGNILKTRDGEPLSGGATAQSDFDGLGQSYSAPQSPAGYPTAPAAPQAPVGYPTAPLAAPQAPVGYPSAPAGYPAIDPITGLPR